MARNPEHPGDLIEEGVLDQSEKRRDNKLRFRRRRIWNGFVTAHFFRGKPRTTLFREVSLETFSTLLHYVTAFVQMRHVLRNSKANANVAFIGGGTHFVPRLFNCRPWGRVDIYELEQAIIDKAEEWLPQDTALWSHIQGDWKDNYPNASVEYDLVLYDLSGEDWDKDLIESKMAPGGRWFRLDKYLDDPDKTGRKD